MDKEQVQQDAVDIELGWKEKLREQVLILTMLLQKTLGMSKVGKYA